MAVSLQVHRAETLTARLEFGLRHLAGVHQKRRRQVSVLERVVRIGGGSAAGAGFALFRGGAMEQASLRLVEVAHGAGPSWRRCRRGEASGAMRSLKEQIGKCPPPPALGSATLQV